MRRSFARLTVAVCALALAAPASGRTVRLATAPVGPRAQIEPIGVVYAYTMAGRGTATVVPMSRVESAVR